VSSRFIWAAGSGASIVLSNAGGPGDLPFTQALVGSSPFFYNSGLTSIPDVYIDNYGCQTSINRVDAVLPTWESNWTHYFAPLYDIVRSPLGSTGAVTLAPVLGGAGVLPIDTYSYAITLVLNNVPGHAGVAAGQETSPSFIGSVALSGIGSITLTPSGDFDWGGSIRTSPNAIWGVRIYRSSLTQPTYFLVTDVPLGSGGGPWTDNITNATIAAHAQLTYNRDVPPVKPYGDFVRTAGAFNTYNPGAPMEIHQGRMWYFTYVQNSDTGYSAQYQLWYSNLNRMWEYDKVNNVFLVSVAPTNYPLPASVPTQVPYPLTSTSNVYAYPNNIYLEMPSAIKSLASVLLFWTTNNMYVLYGNSPATYLFQKFADTGCLSANSLAYATTENSVGIFWMSENGIYYTDGQRIQYVSESIRSIIDGLTIRDRFTCCGFYSNHTYYISFSDLNQTWGYRTSTNEWFGPIPYSTSFAISIPSDPAVGPNGFPLGQKGLYQVIAVRPNSYFVDSWFVQTDTDLGQPQTVIYQSSDQAGGNPHMEKEYTHIAIVHKVQSTSINCLVTITVDDDPTKTCSVAFDMSKGPVQVATMSYEGLGGGPLRGFVASMTIQFTTVAVNPTAPIQIKNVTAYGRYASRMLTPTVGL
jgi:hypothetical protein